MASRKLILIVGGTGFVGSNLAKELSKTHSVICTYRHEFTRLKGVEYFPFNGLGEKDPSKSLVYKTEPDVIIYCAGSNEPKPAEADHRKTQHLHSAGATHLLAIAEPRTKYIYISSSWIFSGIDGNFYESDVAIPSSQLGKAKLGAENYIRSRSANHLIIRPAPLIGRGPVDHPSWTDLLRKNDLKRKKSSLPARNLHNPVHIAALTELVLYGINQDIKNKTIHLGGLTKLSLFEAAQQFLKEFEFDPGLIEQTDATGNADPADYSLNFTEALKTFQLKATTYSESLKSLS